MVSLPNPPTSLFKLCFFSFLSFILSVTQLTDTHVIHCHPCHSLTLMSPTHCPSCHHCHCHLMSLMYPSVNCSLPSLPAPSSLQFHGTCCNNPSTSYRNRMTIPISVRGEALQVAITVLETFPRAMAPFAVMTAESGIPWVVVETLAWDLAHPVGRCTAVAALTLTVLQYVDVCMYVCTYVRTFVCTLWPRPLGR